LDRQEANGYALGLKETVFLPRPRRNGRTFRAGTGLAGIP
jgi:hypothetical protein